MRYNTTMTPDEVNDNYISKNWYAVSVMPGSEYLMRDRLLMLANNFEIKVESFIPVNTDKKRNKPMLPGVILLSVDENEIEMLMETPGVKGYYNNIKSKISDQDLSIFKDNMNKKVPNNIEKGNSLLIKKGNFATLLIKIESIENENLTGYINLFGRDTLVTIPREDLI